MSFDPRNTPVNDRVVARWLTDHFPGRKPVDPEPHFVSVPVVDLCLEPGGRRDRQLRYGDSFDVLERRGDLAFGMSGTAAYAGWVTAPSLTRAAARGEPLDWVCVRQTHVYSEPDIKSPERMALSHLSLVATGRREGRFTEIEAGWIPTHHLTDTAAEDPVIAAEIYLGTPYLWGGNTCFGIDCSGLVQAGCHAYGVDCPGDSDQQQDGLGHELPDGAPLQRGDLLFWKGHVAWVADPETILHANAHHMAVVHEGLNEAIARIEAQGGGLVTARKRLEEVHP